MLILTATLTEAKPIIDALGLRQRQKEPFLVFASTDTKLAITGIGALNAAAATGYIVAKPLLSFGICAGQEVGNLYNIKKVIDDCSDKSYILPNDPRLPNATLRTLAKPASRSYKELVDMEAVGVVVAAKKFGVTPKIVKIVSDVYDPASITREGVIKLIEANLEQLLDIIANLKKECI